MVIVPLLSILDIPRDALVLVVDNAKSPQDAVSFRRRSNSRRRSSMSTSASSKDRWSTNDQLPPLEASFGGPAFQRIETFNPFDVHEDGIKFNRGTHHEEEDEEQAAFAVSQDGHAKMSRRSSLPGVMPTDSDRDCAPAIRTPRRASMSSGCTPRMPVRQSSNRAIVSSGNSLRRPVRKRSWVSLEVSLTLDSTTLASAAV